MASINIDINLCNPIKSCPAKRTRIHTLSTHTSEIRINHHLRKMSANLPNAVIMISELLIIEAKLIHKVSCHLLDLVV